eukprot:Sdes_comp19444_c0_seq2m10842
MFHRCEISSLQRASGCLRQSKVLGNLWRVKFYSSEPPKLKYSNKNPFNDVYLGLVPKPLGYFTLLKLRITNNFIYSVAFFHQGPFQKIPLLFASTREMGIRLQLYGGANLSAAKNLGRVMAQRLFMMGIHNVTFDREFITMTHKRLEFIDSLRQNGLQLKDYSPIKNVTKF